MRAAIIAYVPVLHEGYRNFFQKHAKNADLYILGDELIGEFTHLSKEIRQLSPKLIREAVQSWKIFETVNILDQLALGKIIDSGCEIIIPKEDIMIEMRDKYFPNSEVHVDSIFLRWDKHNTVAENPINPDARVSSDEFDKKMMAAADEEAGKSSDWWRQVGCVVLKGDQVMIATHNEHLPSQHSPYVNGDPRNNFKKGINLELGTSIHGEAGAIAEAARRGISLEGAEAYVTTYPCPPCAKLIACSGIKKLFYRVGYGVLDAEAILKQKGVEIVRVE